MDAQALQKFGAHRLTSTLQGTHIWVPLDPTPLIVSTRPCAIDLTVLLNQIR